MQGITIFLPPDVAIDIVCGLQSNIIVSGCSAIAPGSVHIQSTDGIIPSYEIAVHKATVKRLRDLDADDVGASASANMVDLVCEVLSSFPGLTSDSAITVLDIEVNDNRADVQAAIDAIPDEEFEG